MPERVAVVGLHGGQWFGRDAESALWAADVLIGSGRHLSALPADLPAERVELTMPVAAVLDLAAERQQAGQRVCVLASGDPGFFGIVRLAAGRFGEEGVAVHPAPSSVALAFARLGTSWDDATVVSAHGRPVEAAVEAVVSHPKVAVLTSPDLPPEVLAKAVAAAGCGPRRVAVCSRLGEADESVTTGGLDELVAGTFDPLSVVVFQAPGRRGAGEMGLAWGLPDDRFAHRAGMVTKAEVRAVALGKLDLPGAGVLWDVGAGSGSVAVECARLAPGLRVYAVERRADDAERIRANAVTTGHGVRATQAGVHVVEGEAPAVLSGLPDPDRAFVGGGGIDVLDAVLARLRPGGVVVATYAALDRAAAAAEQLGNLVQIAVSRGVGVGDAGSLRLAAENPVFVCWGPER